MLSDYIDMLKAIGFVIPITYKDIINIHCESNEVEDNIDNEQ